MAFGGIMTLEAENCGRADVAARVRRRAAVLPEALRACELALSAEADRWFLWLPVLFGAGILVYFELPREPGLLATGLLLLSALGLLVALWRAPLGVALAGAVLAAASGFAAAKLRTEMTRAPLIQYRMNWVKIGGWIEAVEGHAGGRSHITVRVISLSHRGGQPQAYRLRVSLAAKTAKALRTGEAVSFWASLMPPPEPVEPYGFDYGRKAWFRRIGGTGYVTSHVKPLPHAPPEPFALRLKAKIDQLRGIIAGRIRASLPGENGGLAVALITGDRAGIPDSVQQAMRNAGLAHILSISGLHMMLMAGAVFWLVRALLAAIPPLALRLPIKKWAAVASLLAGLFYLAISGAAVPTVRAWIMMSIVLLAVLLDRPALSMRNVAVAALLILVFAPEQIFDPSFEMSFAAVVALIAAYESLPRWAGAPAQDISLFWRGLRFAGLAVAGAALTTGIAGTATAPFAVYHFHRMSYYGLAANTVAVPLVSLEIMPMALLSLIAMPFGLEYWPLQAMGFGIDGLVAVGRTVSSWPGAVSLVPAISGLSLALIAFGGVWLCLWRRPWRYAGLLIAGIGLMLTASHARPDLLVERQGAAIAIRTPDGRLALAPGGKPGYSAVQWLLADGDGRAAAAAVSPSAFDCDSLGCMARLKHKTIAFLRQPAAQDDDCALADILVAPFRVAKACRSKALVIDSSDLRRDGAVALYIDGGRIRSQTVAAARGQRPWVLEASRDKP
jgi:competence protein ComEC